MYSGSDTDDNELLSHDVTSGEKQITSDEVTNTSAGGGTTGNKHAADAPITQAMRTQKGFLASVVHLV